MKLRMSVFCKISLLGSLTILSSVPRHGLWGPNATFTDSIHVMILRYHTIVGKAHLNQIIATRVLSFTSHQTTNPASLNVDAQLNKPWTEVESIKYIFGCIAESPLPPTGFVQLFRSCLFPVNLFRLKEKYFFRRICFNGNESINQVEVRFVPR